jgi:hypothetical protein
MRSLTQLLSVLALPALAGIGPVWAQDSAPAPRPQAPANAEQPALDTGAATQRIGTDVVGERESPIGLYITPWKDSGAEQALERPARLLTEELVPIDEDVFIRTLEYYEALSGALRDKNAVTPAVPAATQTIPLPGRQP